jgi:D-glycero-alpha-D-manno-heptose-7-phosphate kinase
MHIARYPDAEVRPLTVPKALWTTVDRGLAHIAYGSPHDSSAVHDEVIAVLADEGPSSPRLERLRQLAGQAEEALVTGNLDRYGRVLRAATDAQQAMHPALISEAAHELIDVARSCDAAGWKVNGAGGGGGSISILCRREPDRDRVIDEALALGHVPLPLALSHQGARAVEG